jgi:glycosyltransferase involved in cell wall biosynthesis
MQFDPSKIYLTAHWADRIFSYPFSLMEGSFPFDSRLPTVLYTGRISKEKGVMELPGIMRLIRSVIPEVRLIVAGTGPAEEALRMEMPDACFLGWVDRETLPVLFRSCDLLLLPSRFDTFSCVVLEALACGLPVIAYNSKGPKDIIRDAVNGYLVGNKEEMAGKAIDYFLSPDQQKEMKKAALQRAEDYQPGKILDQLLKDTGILSYR